jgi:hypothetical protein
VTATIEHEAASRRGGRRLMVWGLATFHAVGFVLVLLPLLYAGGSLGSLLQGLNTVVGFALFGTLWATNWLCTRQALRRTAPAVAPASAEGQPADPQRLPRL